MIFVHIYEFEHLSCSKPEIEHLYSFFNLPSVFFYYYYLILIALVVVIFTPGANKWLWIQPSFWVIDLWIS